MRTSSGDGTTPPHRIVRAPVSGVESMRSGGIFAEPTVWENSLVNLVNNRIPDAAAKIVRQFLAIRRENNVMVWMPAEIPRRKEGAGDKAFTVTGRNKDHQSRYFSALDRFQFRHNKIVVPR